MRFLIAESEPPETRERRRETAGCSSGESFEATLDRLAPGVQIDRTQPVDGDGHQRLDGYDAIFLTGSPIHLYRETAETRRVVEFMRAAFRTGVPAFGSCAGLQIATVAAGGSVAPMGDRREAGFARCITRVDGVDHPLLAGRPAAWDAPAVHTDDVERLPDGALLLALNGTSPVQAAEIRHAGGVFWGVQYHPEINLSEVAAALRRQVGDLKEHGLVRDDSVLEAYAADLERLHNDPARRDLAWRAGLSEEVTDPARRTRELANFIEHLVKPTRSARGRA